MPKIFLQSELATVQQDLTPKKKAIEVPKGRTYCPSRRVHCPSRALRFAAPVPSSAPGRVHACTGG